MPIKDKVTFLEVEETLLTRHKAEIKQMQAKVQQLKKSVNKDKTKKKEVQDEIAVMEKALHDCHATELDEFRNLSSNQPERCREGIESLHVGDAYHEDEVKDAAELCHEADEEQTGSKGSKKVTRAEKRRQKKAASSRERQMLIKESEKANKFSARNVETEKMKKNLKERGLQMHEISPDGNCLYAAIAHQLGPESSVSELRSEAAKFMRSHTDDFLPFLTDPSSGDLLTPAQFDEYCTLLETTPAWGGQPELRALSQVLKKRIEVLQAEGSPVVFGEKFTTEKGLSLAYYRHYYGLGEHYNSVVPLQQQDEQTDGV